MTVDRLAQDAFEGGFRDPVFDAQAVFRAILSAMAEPVRPVTCSARAVAPAPMPPLMASIAATLLDPDTPVWLDESLGRNREVAGWLAFQTGAPVVTERSMATFAFVADPDLLPPLSSFAVGTDEYPDRSTTVIVQVDGFDFATGPDFHGPGFDAPRRFALKPALDRLTADLTINRSLFPRGVDLLFLACDTLVGLPRSSRLQAVQPSMGGG